MLSFFIFKYQLPYTYSILFKRFCFYSISNIIKKKRMQSKRKNKKFCTVCN